MPQKIIVLTKGDQQEVWGSLTDICDAHPEIRYQTVKEKKYPFTYKGYSFVKIRYKQKLIG